MSPIKLGLWVPLAVACATACPCRRYRLSLCSGSKYSPCPMYTRVSMGSVCLSHCFQVSLNSGPHDSHEPLSVGRGQDLAQWSSGALVSSTVGSRAARNSAHGDSSALHSRSWCPEIRSVAPCAPYSSVCADSASVVDLSDAADVALPYFPEPALALHKAGE